MDEETYQRCLQYLAAAEECMIEGVDGWHLARLSMVIECLKEAYGPGLWPIISPVPPIQ
jgi:hypothetical protein